MSTDLIGLNRTIVLATALLCASTYFVVAESSREALQRQIVELSVYQHDNSRNDATLEECVYHINRWDADPKAGEILMSHIQIDLRTARLDLASLYRMAKKMAQQGHETIEFTQMENSFVVQDIDSIMGTEEASIGFVATEAAPLIREEPIFRDRAKDAIKQGLARPSSRGDGNSYVFFDDTSLSYIMKGAGSTKQLLALEAAILDYQERFCTPGGA